MAIEIVIVPIKRVIFLELCNSHSQEGSVLPRHADAPAAAGLSGADGASKPGGQSAERSQGCMVFGTI